MLKPDIFITVLTFNHPIELAVIRARIESEGIACFVQDELTAQINPFYSNAIGGVKLQVKESDLEKAVEILKDCGYIKDNDIQPSKLFTNIENITSTLPFIGKVRVELRLMIIVAVVVGLLLSVVYFATLPSTFDRLTKNSWCLDVVLYNGKNFIPQTEHRFTVSGFGVCEESITLRENGTITLPSFKSETVWGMWQLYRDTLFISNVDTFDFVYNGNYKLDFSSNNLTLESSKTILHCRAENFNFDF